MVVVDTCSNSAGQVSRLQQGRGDEVLTLFVGSTRLDDDNNDKEKVNNGVREMTSNKVKDVIAHINEKDALMVCRFLPWLKEAQMLSNQRIPCKQLGLAPGVALYPHQFVSAIIALLRELDGTVAQNVRETEPIQVRIGIGVWRWSISNA